ncbi:NARF domain-containing protein [Bernardetia sp. MNP-M8]|uniref:NARF domain-containing protein n=1 Tax=Bernardetia sp. MNP-M8 TaxID=3127470 RepID=UPI0030CD2DE6
MKKYIFGIFVLFFSFFFSVAYGQSNKEIKKDYDEIKKEISTLKNQIKTKNSLIDSLIHRDRAWKYMFEGGGFEKRIESENKFWASEAKDFQAEVKRDNTYVLILLMLLAGVTGGAIIIFFTTYKTKVSKILASEIEKVKMEINKIITDTHKKAKEDSEELASQIENEIIETLAKVANTSKEEMKAIIENQREEFQLINRAKIVALVKVGKDAGFISDFFDKYDFNKNNILILTEEEYKERKTEADTYDTLLINNENNSFSSDKAIIEEYIKNAKNKVCFYFGALRVDADSEKSNFASTRTTLYIQLLALLRYKKLMLD